MLSEKFEKFDEEYQELKTTLIKLLPSKIMGWDNKNTFHLRYPKPTSYQLDNKKWIMYNQNWLNTLWIDIDDTKTIKHSIDSIMDKCISMGFEPSIILKTDKGIQVCYILENIIKPEWEKSIKFAYDIKKMLTEKLNGDKIASHRLLKTIYRNPLQHEHIYSDLFYNLNDFKELLKEWRKSSSSIQKQFKRNIVERKIESKEFTFKQGHRNEYLFRMGMKYSKNKNYTEVEIFNYLKELQETFKEIENLEDNEIMATSRSIYKYNQNGSNNFTSLDYKEVEKKNRGVMKYEKIKGLKYEDYLTETKRRQSESGKRTQEIIKKDKEKEMTRVEICKKIAKDKMEKNYRKVVNLITGDYKDDYKKKNGTWNISKIARELNIDIKTANKHFKSYMENN